jgi:hypothetical protein
MATAKPKTTTKPRASKKAAPSSSAPTETSNDSIAPAGETTPVVENTSAAEVSRLVEEAAYYKAEKRGFTPGYELQDWLEAEAEVLGRAQRRP